MTPISVAIFFGRDHAIVRPDEANLGLWKSTPKIVTEHSFFGGVMKMSTVVWSVNLD